MQRSKQRVRVLGMHGDQQAARGLRVIHRVLHLERGIARIDKRLRVPPVAVHALGQHAHARKLKRLGRDIDGVRVDRQVHIAALRQLKRMSQQAEASHIRAGVHAELHHRVARRLVERRHARENALEHVRRA